jgi:CDGSH-type Zn-finger protein
VNARISDIVNKSQINPTVAKAPIATELGAGKKVSWCSCGYSTNQPFCDGTHGKVATNLRPIITEISESKKYYFCACKETGKPPFCDGTHSKL